MDCIDSFTFPFKATHATRCQVAASAAPDNSNDGYCTLFEGTVGAYFKTLNLTNTYALGSQSQAFQYTLAGQINA